MVYSELLFFLGVLPASVALSFLDRSAEYKNLILIITSLAFVSWGKPMWCLLMFLSVIAEYLIGLGIGKFRENSRPAAAALLGFDLLLNTGLFLLLAHNSLFSEDSALHLRAAVIPIGAAWYTAKAFSYSFDVFTGRCKAEKNIFCLLTYMISFHFLAAGPVVRYGDIEPHIRKRSVTGRHLSDGLDRFIIGLGKVVILTPVFTRLASAGLDHRDRTLAGSWIGIAAFFAECWFSFTGLCDMAKGIGLLGGFDFEENYRPVSTKNMFTGFVESANTSFIKLLRDFFGMFTRGNVFFGAVCCLAGGVIAALWYDISKPFAAVGIAVGAVMMIERLIPEATKEKIPLWIKTVYVLFFGTLIIGGLRFTSIDGYKNWLFSLFGSGNEYVLSKALKRLLIENLFLIIISVCYVCVPLRQLIGKGVKKIEDSSVQGFTIMRVGRTLLTAGVLVICVITLAAQKVA